MHTSGLVWNHAFLLKGDRLRKEIPKGKTFLFTG
jgi:hypothetical protein